MESKTHDVTEWAVKVDGLVKRYGERQVLRGLSLRVPRGGVHGLLGPNGSGKTTSIRVMLGLARPDGGTVELLGHQVPSRLPRIIGRVGAIVESPKFAPRMSARRSLEILAQSIGVERRRVIEVLLEVGLADHADAHFGSYSLGMKQRLAIAATLLKRPELLIFDEPTNGLDPEGIHDIRTTLRGLGQSGRTVLLSSQLLSEVEQVADSLSIIEDGRVVAEGTITDLLAEGEGDVHVSIDQAAEAAEVLRRCGWRVVAESDGLSVTARDGVAPDAALVARHLGQMQLWPHELTTRRRSLERVYLDLVREREA